MSSYSLAYLRDDLEEEGSFPPSSISISDEEWCELSFRHYTFDVALGDFAPEYYNIALVHPKTGEIFFSYSHYFNFFWLPTCKPSLTNKEV